MTYLSRRRWLACLTTGMAAAAIPRLSLGQAEFDAGRSADLITNETQRAIDRGLAWLSKRQMMSGKSEGAFGHGGYAGGVAVSSLAGLAFMCSGSPPGQGPFGKNIDRCVKFITSCVQETGYISVPGFGQDNMYGHGHTSVKQ
jgi:hypothetical protein